MSRYRNDVEPEQGDRVVYVGDDERWVNELPDGRPLWDVTGSVTEVLNALGACVVSFDGKDGPAVIVSSNLMRVGDS